MVVPEPQPLTWRRRPAVTIGSRTVTYAELNQMVHAAADGYRSLGIGAEDLITCQFPNGLECLVAACAAWRLGAVHAPIDPYLTDAELLRTAEQTASRAFIRRRAGAAVVVTRDRSGRAPARGSSRPWRGDSIFAPCWPGQLATDVLAIAREIGRLGQFGPDDVHLAHLPLSTCVGLSLAVAALITGGRLVLLERYSANAAAHAVATQDVTVMSGSPQHFLSLDDIPIGTLRVAVAALHPFPVETLGSLLAGRSRRLLALYCPGGGVLLGTSSHTDILAGSVGRPRVGSVTLLDSRGQGVPVGEPGEIAVIDDDRRPRRTGDLGWLDDEARLHVVGRRHRQIVRVGQRIDPVPIETALRRCPEVRDAAVIGIRNQVLGESVCACVVPSGSRPPTLGTLWPVLGTRLPDQLCITRTIPRTRLGEIDVGCLRAYVLESSCESAPYRYS